MSITFTLPFGSSPGATKGNDKPIPTAYSPPGSYQFDGSGRRPDYNDYARRTATVTIDKVEAVNSFHPPLEPYQSPYIHEYFTPSGKLFYFAGGLGYDELYVQSYGLGRQSFLVIDGPNYETQPPGWFASDIWQAIIEVGVIGVIPANTSTENGASFSVVFYSTRDYYSMPPVYEWRFNGGQWMPAQMETTYAQSIPSAGWVLIECRLTLGGVWWHVWWQWFFINATPVAIVSAVHVFDSTEDDADFGRYHFDGASSYDPDGGAIASYLWQYDAGPTTTLMPFLETLYPETAYGQQKTVALTVKDAFSAQSSIAQATFTIPIKVQQTIGAFLHPNGTLFTAMNTSNKSVQIARQRAQSVAMENLGAIQDAKNPALWQRKQGQKTTGTFELVARVISSKLWKLWRSFNGGQDWTMIGTPFQSTSIDYLDAAPAGNGAIAVAIIKGATTAQNTLVVKRTQDVKNWPDDSAAVTIKTGLPNKPVAICAAPDGSTSFSITGAGLTWLRSKDGLKWE